MKPNEKTVEGCRPCESKIGTEHGDILKKTTAILFITFK